VCGLTAGSRHVSRLAHGVLALTLLACSPAMADAPQPTSIVVDDHATPQERLAAQEIRRYLYVTSGTLASVVTTAAPGERHLLLGTGSEPFLRPTLERAGVATVVEALPPDGYVLKTVDAQTTLVVGGSPTSTLHAAYRFAGMAASPASSFRLRR
jgi:hypothetical protein